MSKIKKITSLFMINLAFLQFVPPTVLATTEPTKPSLVIYQVQTAGAGTGTSTQEVVSLYNFGDLPEKVTNWCIEYSSANDNIGFRSCLTPASEKIELWVEPKGVVSFATNDFSGANPLYVVDIVMNGGMSSNGHVRLLNMNKQIVDTIGWGSAIHPENQAATAHMTGKVLSRSLTNEPIDTNNNKLDFTSQTLASIETTGLYETEIIPDLCSNIDDIQATLPDGFLADEQGECWKDICANIDDLQVMLPDGYRMMNDKNTCDLIPLEDAVLMITELRPNAPGVDDGQEFIELYNPNNREVNLAGYQLQVGPNYTKKFIFDQSKLASGAYISFNDKELGIVLPNTTGVVLRLVSPAGNLVSETEVYAEATDDVSWGLIEDQWQYTNQITPAAANKPLIIEAEDEVFGVSSVFAPCPAGKYRNPETNRCRVIEQAISQLAPCDEDEYRNLETSRCNKIKSQQASTLAACPEGQERNPETNRCRKVSVLGTTSKNTVSEVVDVAPEVQDPVNWWLLFLTVGSTMSYMLYEWRHEMWQKLQVLHHRRGTMNA